MPRAAPPARNTRPPRSGEVALELAGAGTARIGTQELTLQPGDALLLAWLAIEGPTPRERLAGLLWPASSAAASRNALRQRLHRLRAQLGTEVAAGTPVLALAPGVTHNLALDPTPGLLGEADAGDCPELQAWLNHQRSTRQAQARHTTEEQLDAFEAAGDATTALPLAQALLDANPLSEDAHRRVMRLHYLRGDRAAALLAFDRCEQMLKHEIGATPSSATLALLQTLQRAGDAAEGLSGPRPPPALLRPPQLIGRATELQTLRQALPGGGTVLLIGEAGMGKSRLIQALASGQAGVLHASGRPGDALVPYATLARALRQLIERDPLADDADLRNALTPLLPELGTAALVTTPASRPIEPVTALLLRPTRTVQVLALDDLHFADDASVDLLQALLTAARDPRCGEGSAAKGGGGGGEAIGLCLGLRPPLPGSRLASLLDTLAVAAPHTRLLLQPLTEAAMVTLVDSLALPGVQGVRIAPRLHALTGGNPLFAIETLKLAWADGRLRDAMPGTGDDALSHPLSHPQSLTQLIGQQLARLSPAALQLARAAAVAGVDFSIPLAEALLKRSALDLADAWSELEAQQVLRGTAFAHDLIHDTVLQGLPEAIARHLHGQAAAWLEDPRQGAEPARVAAHWEAAGQRARALPALRQAADHAHRTLREGERIAFLLRAADIAEAAADPDEAFDLVRTAVEAHMDTIRQADGLPLLERLQTLARTPLQAARLAGDRAWYAAVMGDLESAVALGEQALAAALPLGDRALLASLRQRLGTAYGMCSRFEEALQLMRVAEPEIERLSGHAVVCEFHGNLAVLLDNHGQPEAAQRHHLRALQLSLQHSERSQQATQLANYAHSRLDAGDVATAFDLAMQAQRIVTQDEIAGSSAGFVATLLATCERGAGRYSGALAWCDRAESILAERNPSRVPVALLQRAHIWLDLGQHARVAQLLGGAGLEMARSLPPRYAVRWLTLLARLQRRLGQSSAELLAEAGDRAPGNGFPELTLIVHTEQALELAPAKSVARLDALAADARGRHLHGAELAALQQAAMVDAGTTPAGQRRCAARAAAIILLSQTTEALHADRALRWLAPALALRRAGQNAEADARVVAGRDWLAQTVAMQLAPVFIESFLHQHPVHRQLGTWV